MPKLQPKPRPEGRPQIKVDPYLGLEKHLKQIEKAIKILDKRK